MGMLYIEHLLDLSDHLQPNCRCLWRLNADAVSMYVGIVLAFQGAHRPSRETGYWKNEVCIAIGIKACHALKKDIEYRNNPGLELMPTSCHAGFQSSEKPSLGRTFRLLWLWFVWPVGDSLTICRL